MTATVARRRRCRHCRRKPTILNDKGDRGALWPRGLCRLCYYDPAIRERYRRIRGTVNTESRLPALNRVRLRLRIPQPTQALPGSAEKIAVLMARVAAGQYLHHPKDRREVDLR